MERQECSNRWNKSSNPWNTLVRNPAFPFIFAPKTSAMAKGKKIPFRITAEKSGDDSALIRITGEIGWDVDAESFRHDVDVLRNAGVKNIHLYINSPGGSCFDAAEIVNILSGFDSITGEGGALVASAATYIAMHCAWFTMPANGNFMIHQPSMGTWGTVKKIESDLTLLRNLADNYLSLYKGKAKDKEAFQRQWDSDTDYWLTAQEAKDAGFVTAIKENVNIDQESEAMLRACGCPAAKALPDINTNKETGNMEIKTLQAALGLPEKATEAEVLAAITNGRNASAELDRLKADIAKKEKEAKDAEITALVDEAVKAKRITEESRATWTKLFNSDFDSAKSSLESIKPVEKLSVHGTQGDGKVTGGKYNGKTFEELQDEDPDTLKKLEKEDEQAFNALFDDYKKRKHLN